MRLAFSVYVVRVAIVAFAAFAGWMTGNGLGYVSGVALDTVTGNDWVSWVLLTVPLAGFMCTALALWLGWRLARRVVTPRQALLAGSGVVATFTFGLFVVVPTAKGFCVLPSADVFDAVTWQADNGDWPCTDRAGMAPQLVNDVLEVGMTEEMVRELLGPPTDDPGIAWPDRDALIWKVRCGIDCQWLVLTMDEGNLANVELAED